MEMKTMLKKTIATTAAALFMTTGASLFQAPPANAGIEDILDQLEEFDDIADCDYEYKRIKVRVRTAYGYKWVWVKKRVRVCD